jgi:tRNA1(Val) A37 N6-methylase TrmN6
MTDTSSTAVLRFVPQGAASLLDDAPGWEDSDGPTCWKCKGVGTTIKFVKHIQVVVEKSRSLDEAPIDENAPVLDMNSVPQHLERRQLPQPCPVCQGRGYLRKRKIPENPGKITRGRKRPQEWRPDGPDPIAISKDDDWSKMVLKANEDYIDMEIQNQDDGPDWLPGRGEELCNLVGTWRILQRVGSHRWTTDDIVTAWVASSTYQRPATTTTTTTIADEPTINYLDLGTGNASVLQMVTWAFLRDGRPIRATGVEARSEAVGLARRSLQFNLGAPTNTVAQIIHGDFRDVALENNYDLVTGTPPYFRVDFSINSNNVVSKAVINQGGMPTSKQSAPARCEFRGGIEAYCAAATSVLKKDTGRFVVCENWLNHDRVVMAAQTCGLLILRQVQVMGREQKDTLFCVYVMRKCASVPESVDTVVQKLIVRRTTGEWTEDYKELVLGSMSIPS